jgi:ABC-type protease/lipase transport system fused ATPase/permease subunit
VPRADEWRDQRPYLTGSFFMLEILRPSLPSHSIPTLLGLGIVATLLYAGQAILDLIRSRTSVTASVTCSMPGSANECMEQLSALRLRGNGDTQQPMRDLYQQVNMTKPVLELGFEGLLDCLRSDAGGADA